VSFNAWYDRGYVEGEAVPPACFAIGPDPEELVPSEKSPVRQADSCAECAFNEWGSKGKGKMCGNHRVLAVVEDSDDPKAPIMTLKVSPTGIRYWDAHVADCFAANPAGPIAAVTEIYFDEDSDYPSLRFCSPEPSVNENVALHVTRQSVAADKLAREPDVSQYEPPKPVARGTSRKK
jgi:hypothetical protein